VSKEGFEFRNHGATDLLELLLGLSIEAFVLLGDAMRVSSR
jgi:hypothetical protein